MKKYAFLGDSRGLGLVWGLEIIDPENPGAKKPDTARAKAIVQNAWKNGLLMMAPIGHYGNLLRIAPPLVINEKELNLAIDIIDQAMADAA
jgi:4-aminobutyrate aminotransferase-like enzyme